MLDVVNKAVWSAGLQSKAKHDRGRVLPSGGFCCCISHTFVLLTCKTTIISVRRTGVFTARRSANDPFAGWRRRALVAGNRETGNDRYRNSSVVKTTLMHTRGQHSFPWTSLPPTWRAAFGCTAVLFSSSTIRRIHLADRHHRSPADRVFAKKIKTIIIIIINNT